MYHQTITNNIYIMTTVRKTNKVIQDNVNNIIRPSGLILKMTSEELKDMNETIKKELLSTSDTYTKTYLKQVKEGINYTNITTFRFISTLLKTTYKSKNNRYIIIQLD